MSEIARVVDEENNALEPRRMDELLRGIKQCVFENGCAGAEEELEPLALEGNDPERELSGIPSSLIAGRSETNPAT